ISTAWNDVFPGAVFSQASPLEWNVRFDRFRVTAAEIVTHALKSADVIDFRMDEPDIEHVIKQVYEGLIDLKEA
ncbi:MAG: hypothetical protein J7559_09125, partial [Cohnella sp.]|nr:hypothetical protein [Cohnella sp.]